MHSVDSLDDNIEEYDQEYLFQPIPQMVGKEPKLLQENLYIRYGSRNFNN